MKKIRSKIVKESLLDYERLANSLKENTSIAVKDLLNEAVRDTYNQILNEEDDNNEDEYEVEEVEDTTPDNETAEVEDESDDEADDAVESSDEEADEELDNEELDDEESDNSDDELPETDLADSNIETDSDLEADDTDANDEWAEFEKYKVSDDEYDFSDANDDEIVKVYKLLKDDDQILVNVDKETKKVELKDNETGAEYLLDLSSFNDDLNFDDEDSHDLTTENKNMNESRVFEIMLNEYDSHVGYTDNYQKNDVMSTPDMSEPGKNVNDWDAGVPKGKSKPWVGKGNSKPFNEEEEMDVTDEAVEEGTNVGGFVQQNSTSKSHVPNSSGRKARNSSVAGVKTKSTSEPRYSGIANESKIMAKVNSILNENKELKSALVKFKKVLQEAAVVNVNLGQIIKLISENSTTKTEKEEIIRRFGNEAKTVEQSKQLYETISRELKKNNTMSIDEDKQFMATSSKQINETQIYKSKDLLESLDLMHRLCK